MTYPALESDSVLVNEWQLFHQESVFTANTQYIKTQNILSKTSFFRPSKITHFVQNFVQIYNFCPHLIQLLKGI